MDLIKPDNTKFQQGYMEPSKSLDYSKDLADLNLNVIDSLSK